MQPRYGWAAGRRPTYWSEILNFDALVRHGVIARADLSLLSFVDDPGTALANLQAAVETAPEAVRPHRAFADAAAEARDGRRSAVFQSMN